MGQLDSARISYGKSAKLIEQENRGTHWENQTSIRQWIGELLLIRGETEASLSLLVAEANKWAIISPPNARRLNKFIADEFGSERADWPNAAAAERFALRWIDQTTGAS